LLTNGKGFAGIGKRWRAAAKLSRLRAWIARAFELDLSDWHGDNASDFSVVERV